MLIMSPKHVPIVKETSLLDLIYHDSRVKSVQSFSLVVIIIESVEAVIRSFK